MTVRQNISQLFDDLDNGNADLLAAGLVYNSERVKNYQPGPTYYSVSQQLVYKVGQYRPRTLGNLTAEQLTVAPGHVVVNDLQTLKETKFPELSWKVDDKKGSAELMEDVIEGKLDYTIADSVAISLFQRVHPELAVALDITDEQPVTWFSPLDGDNTLSAALLDFFNEMNEDGTLARIEEKYLGHGDDFDYIDTRTFLRAVDAVLPQLKPLFEKYAEEIDWRSAGRYCLSGIALGCTGHFTDGCARHDDVNQKYRAKPRHYGSYRCRTEHQRWRALFAGYDE